MIEAQSPNIVIQQQYYGEIVLWGNNFSIGSNKKIIFKIKSNFQNIIEVKPSHGFIQRGRKIILQIRYAGQISNINKTKLKVCWLPIDQQIGHPGMQAQQLAKIYKKYRLLAGQNIQKSLSIPLCFRHQSKDFSVYSYRQGQQTNNLKCIAGRHQQRVGEKALRQVELGWNCKIIIQSEVKLSQDEKNGQFANSLKSVLILALFSFLFGVTFGIKLCKIIQQV